MKNKIKNSALICDLDNTLYDWVNYFVPSFYAMIERAVQITGCNQERLLDDLRRVHQRHHNSEQPFALLEAKCIDLWLQVGNKDEKLTQLDSAFHRFNAVRKSTLKLYAGVIDTLTELSSMGIKLIAHSDSNMFAVIDRVQRLKLTYFFECIYCTEPTNSTHPKGGATSDIFLTFPLHKIVTHNRFEKKPNKNLLNNIIIQQKLSRKYTAYIGDSLKKDVYMANNSGVFAIWAAYGAIYSEPNYNKLIRVSHWTAADVAREREIDRLASGVRPDFICHNSFSEVIEPMRQITKNHVTGLGLEA